MNSKLFFEDAHILQKYVLLLNFTFPGVPHPCIPYQATRVGSFLLALQLSIFSPMMFALLFILLKGVRALRGYFGPL